MFPFRTTIHVGAYFYFNQCKQFEREKSATSLVYLKWMSLLNSDMLMTKICLIAGSFWHLLCFFSLTELNFIGPQGSLSYLIVFYQSYELLTIECFFSVKWHHSWPLWKTTSPFEIFFTCVSMVSWMKTENKEVRSWHAWLVWVMRHLGSLPSMPVV